MFMFPLLVKLPLKVMGTWPPNDNVPPESMVKSPKVLPPFLDITIEPATSTVPTVAGALLSSVTVLPAGISTLSDGPGTPEPTVLFPEFPHVAPRLQLPVVVAVNSVALADGVNAQKM